jgi:hypothetical protein
MLVVMAALSSTARITKGRAITALRGRKSGHKRKAKDPFSHLDEGRNSSDDMTFKE